MLNKTVYTILKGTIHMHIPCSLGLKTFIEHKKFLHDHRTFYPSIYVLPCNDINLYLFCEFPSKHSYLCLLFCLFTSLMQTAPNRQVTSCVKSDIRELKQATFLSTRTAAGSKLRHYRWLMMASAVLV